MPDRLGIRGTLAHAAPSPPTSGPATIEVMHDALLLVEDGLITRIVHGPQADALEALIRAGGDPVTKLAATEVLLPGFIDLHVHAAQATFAGSGTDRPLLGPTGWLETCAYPAERAWSEPAVAEEVANAVVLRALRHGTSTCVYFGTIHVEGTLKLVDVCLAHGQRAVVGKVAMDRCSPADYVESTEESVRHTEAFIEGCLARAAAHASSRHAGGPLVRPAITPRFVPTCSPALLSGLGRLAAKYASAGVYVQSHIAQSADQIAFVEKLHPGERDTALFERHGLLTSRCILAHAIHLQEPELQLLARRHSGIAFCPLSNVFHTELPASSLDSPRALRHGCCVGLATDVAGGYAPSMLSACRTAVVTSRMLRTSTAVDWRHAFWLATRGGAAALSAPVGGFEVGREFDAQLVDVSAGDALLTPHATGERTTTELIERFVNLGDDRNVRAVWVRGREVYRKAGAPPPGVSGQRAATRSEALFSAYLRSVWLIQAATQCYGGSTVGGFFARSNLVLLAAVLATAATRSRALFAAATLARVLLRVASMPFIWEVEVWAVQMDLTLLAARCDVPRAAVAIRAQLIAFYAGAAWWKLNSSFLDPTTSCGTIFFAQLLDAYVPSALLQPSAVPWLLRTAAPAAALAFEIAVPTFLAVRRRAGLALALIFHLLVVLTPPPNNAGGFSVCAAQYLFFFAPHAAADAIDEMCAGEARGLLAAAGVALALGCHVGAHPLFFDTAPPAYALQFVLLVRAVALASPLPPPVMPAAVPAAVPAAMPAAVPAAALTAAAVPAAEPTAEAGKKPLGVALPVAVAVLYAFGLPMLGVLDQMAPNMFSNQRYHGGSNHLLVPTGVAHRALGEAAFAVVRVQSTTSTTMRAQYPAEVSAAFSVGVRRLLHAVGHSGRQWNPMLGRVIGLKAVAGAAHDDASKPAVQYTLPAIELRRLIGEAQVAGESFELKYTRLDGLVPPSCADAEAWRATGGGATAVYRWDARTRTARCRAGRGRFAPACPADEPAMLQRPPSWALWLAAFQPLPIITGEAWGEVHCYGP